MENNFIYFIENIAFTAAALIAYNNGQYYAFQLQILNNIAIKKG